MKTKILILLAAVALLAACKGKSSKSQADSAMAADVALAKTKLVKTADVNFKVKNVLKTGEAIATLTDQYKGMVMHHQMQSAVKGSENVHLTNDSIMLVSSYNTTADMTIKIPSEKLEEFLNKVSHMGIYVNSSKMDIEDRSLDYLSSKLKAENREELVDQQKSGKITLKHPGEILSVKDDIVDKQINNLKTDEDVTYSTITLSFYQSNTISKETIANDDPSAYNIPLFQRLALAFENGWAIFVDMIVGLVNLWMFILAGLAIWRIVVYYRKRIHPVSKPVAN
jgi:Domain of unknown function (DUF4349)